MVGLVALTWSAGAWADDGTMAGLGVKTDSVWILACAAMVFFMQAGFLVFELGLVRKKNVAAVALKNLGDWMVVSLAFLVAGFGLMFGASEGGWIGSSLFMADGLETATATAGGATDLNWSFLVFQLAFCGTAATIVSGAMAERTGFKAYLLFALAMGIFIFPIFGHWVWGSLYLGEGNEGWLEALGYHDFAGASVVHGIGAWASLVGVWMAGPRLGRYGSKGELNRMSCNNLAWTALGTLMLWFGWWGFNGGSALTSGPGIGKIILVTNLAGCAAGFAGVLHAVGVQGRRNVEEKLMGSVLGGLVAVTACADVIGPVEAILIGLVAGPLHNMGFELIIRRLRLDDVVGAVPVHGICGAWGIMAAGIFGDIDNGNTMLQQIGVQGLGLVVCMAWAGGVSLLVFGAIRAAVGLRVDPMSEINGLTLSVAEGEATPDDGMDLGAGVDAPSGGLENDMDKLMAEIRAHVREGERVDVF